MGAGDQQNPSCHEARELLLELLDGNPTAARANEIRHALSACPECWGHLTAELEVRGLVRECCGQVHAPEQLRQRIITSLTTTTVSVTRYRIQP
ncbi:mycothiol system anti-sigma-R factor [Corynebacterium timonense]|uniref:Mycothiol system anti-sigma-R factor n=1 Tax=Corynebacterium timonense TaxID=441500 RepID=A0A1H1RPF5_9CORY|nr:mycothiol system anti-sigma-R factor [Corynebacterium timonense]SDS37595.1 mycothiol system anti-sigma-R factor [Corynebacterium timonense]